MNQKIILADVENVITKSIRIFKYIYTAPFKSLKEFCENVENAI